MDPLGLVPLARALVDVDSTTGREEQVSQWLAAYLRDLGYGVVEQHVSDGRINVFASLDRPRVVLSTHTDCVPPFFPSSVQGSRLYGRGSCDAKGILASMIVAAERLRAHGTGEVGLLFVVGEERGSDGALAANALADGCEFLIDGEPTDNRLGLATRGVVRIRLRATGRAAHSSHPELGESAIEKLLDALRQLRTIELPADPLLGRTHYIVGLIEGGIAPNVVPPMAWAEVLFRSVGPGRELREAIRSLEPLVTFEDVLEVSPVWMHGVPGFETEVFPYTTDIPLLSRWGRPLLYGPGSVLVAHTDHEHVEIAHLERAVDDYALLVKSLLNQDLS
jgi:acetylornithine deacetylase